MEEAADLKVLCQHEYHASEPGWHCHFTSKDTRDIPPGAARPHLNRRPKFERIVDAEAFGVSEDSALRVAAYRYGFKDHGLEEQADFGL